MSVSSMMLDIKDSVIISDWKERKTEKSEIPTIQPHGTESEVVVTWKANLPGRTRGFHQGIIPVVTVGESHQAVSQQVAFQY